jgi:hypothetical protein
VMRTEGIAQRPRAEWAPSAADVRMTSSRDRLGRDRRFREFRAEGRRRI